MDAFVPTSLGEALELRAAYPDAVPVAGGTDLMVELNFGRIRPATILDLSRVDELVTWHRRADGSVFVGARMTFAGIAREPAEFGALADAARTVGSAQIRNRATIGGNLATASPAGDSLPVLAAYESKVVVASASTGERKVPWHEFLIGPKRTSLEPDELIVGVEWDPASGPGYFAKVGPRNAMVIAVAGVCVQLDETTRRVRVGLGSVGPTVLRAPDAEAFAVAVIPWDEPGAGVPGDALEEFGRLAAARATPIDDLRGSAAYRRHVVDRLARRTLGWSLRDRGGAAC